MNIGSKKSDTTRVRSPGTPAHQAVSGATPKYGSEKTPTKIAHCGLETMHLLLTTGEESPADVFSAASIKSVGTQLPKATT